MPDIISRIRLEATGADQVAREIDKIRGAYDKTAQSAQDVAGVTVGAGGVDPFTRAVQRGGGESTVLARQDRSRMEGAAYDRRMGQHYDPQGGGFGQALQLSRQMTGTVGAAKGGNLQGVLGGVSSVAGTATAAGIGAALIAVVTAALGMAAGREFTAAGALYESGITRRLGTDFITARKLQVPLSRSGIPRAEVDALFGALGAAGGALEGIGEFGITGTQAERMSRYGISPGIMGQFMATTRRAGETGTDELSMQLLGRTFGIGRTGPGLQQAGQILEEAMARGARTSSSILREGAGRIAREAAGLSQIGGLSMEGAFGMIRQMQGRIVQGVQPQTGLDTMTLRAVMSERGLSLFGAQEWISRNPLAARGMQMQLLREQTGGNRDLMGRILMGQGFGAGQAGAWLDVMGGYGKREGLGPLMGREREGGFGRLLRYGAAVETDVPMKLLTKLRQMELLADIGPGGEGLLTTVLEMIQWYKKILWPEGKGAKIPEGGLTLPPTSPEGRFTEPIKTERELQQNLMDELRLKKLTDSIVIQEGSKVELEKTNLILKDIYDDLHE